LKTGGASPWAKAKTLIDKPQKRRIILGYTLECFSPKNYKKKFIRIETRV
jgi:hypothetical protein